MGTALAGIVKSRLADVAVSRPNNLRMSNLGKPDRQLWYQIKSEEPGEVLSASTRVKFLFGDILELLLLFLAKEAGHEVGNEQEEVKLNGIVGHIDAIIDGVVIDCKSASTQSYRKFKDGSLAENDPFGYMEQLAGYSRALGGLGGGFLAIDKTLGHICLHEVPADELEALNIEDRIEHLKEVVVSEDIPDRCYDPVPMGESGNMTLGVNCSYCAFKDKCWADANGGIGLRTFLYAKGPTHFTHVEKEPNVPELTF